MKRFFQAGRLSWPITFSILLHVSLIVGLIYASLKLDAHLPEQQDDAPMNVMMIDPAMFTGGATESAVPPVETAAPPTPPEPEVAREPEPEVKPEPVPVEKPIVKPKPKPKPKNKPEKKPEKKSVQPRPERLVETTQSSTSTSTQQTSATAGPISSAPVSSSGSSMRSEGSRPLKQALPAYPRRALELRLEGKVVVLFDIDSDGSTSNIRIISADPANIFDRDVRRAIQRWKYTAVAVQNKRMTIIFDLSGRAKIM